MDHAGKDRYTIHATKKLLDRVRSPAVGGAGNTTTTLAPASTLAVRFPHALAEILTRLDTSAAFITAELISMREALDAKTARAVST